MKSIFSWVAVFLLASSAPAQTTGVIVTGVGASGTWGTSLDFANPGSAPLRFNLIPDRRQCVAAPCDYVIPPNGTISIGPESLQGPLQTVIVVPEEGSATPVVRAHVLDVATRRGADLLAVSARSIQERSAPQGLSFPGVTRNATTHANLILAGISATPATFPTDTFAANIQLFDHDGNPLGNRLVANNCAPSVGEAPAHCPDLFLVDVVAQLGVEAIEGGQLSVTMMAIDPPNVPLSQAASIWGALASVSSDVPSAVIGGANP
jgi:hypothetical protein